MMGVRPVMTFPNAERLIVTALTGLISAEVRADVPNPRPDEFVVIRRTGGVVTAAEVTDEPILVVEGWAMSPTRAEAIAQACRSHIHGLTGTVVDGTPIYRVVELSGPANLPDPDSDHYRYTFSIVVGMRGTAS